MSLGVQRSFDDLGASLHEVPFCVVDLETTGGLAADCGITEIGAVKYQGGELLGTFQTMVNPGISIPPFITVLTGITQAMVTEAPHLEEAYPAFLEFLGDAVVVGHNVRYDLSFLNAAGRQLGYGRLPHRSVDTAALARRLIPSEVRNLKLGTLAAYFRSPTTPNHRALEDAKATAHVLWALLERAGTIGVTHLEDLMELPTARGSRHYNKLSLTDELPRAPGVYLFRDRHDNVIYIGKAKNLRTRVRAYFYGDKRRTITDLLRELHRIEHRVCETELEAEVTELRLIAASRPRYNRRSKPPKSSHWVKLTDEEFPRLSVVRSRPSDDSLRLGPFRSKTTADRVVAAIWDAVPIRRCTGKPGSKKGTCAFAQLEVAVCPCAGDVYPEDYRPVVEALIRGIDEDPATLLQPLTTKITQHAAALRFEEAGWVRDRHRALASAIERRRAWQALQRAGSLWAQDRNGDSALIERGRFVAGWSTDRPFDAIVRSPQLEMRQVPDSVGEAEEAQLVWKWLCGAEVIEATGALALPTRSVPRLDQIAI